MRSIKSKDNKTTERRFRFALVRNGIGGWTLHPVSILGRPDFYFEIIKLAIFVDGCFWHGCPKCSHTPRNNTKFWKAKIGRNKKRDSLYTAQLRSNGFIVVRFWEHQIATELDLCIKKVKKLISDEIEFGGGSIARKSKKPFNWTDPLR